MTASLFSGRDSARFRPGSRPTSSRALPPDRGLGLRVLLDVPYAETREDRHKLDLYLPDRDRFPVVVLAHGGAWMSGDKALFGHVGIFLAKNGIGAALVNYRLAPRVRHPVPAQDLARAFAWIEAHVASHGGDPKRLYLCGHSAGAHLAALLGTDESFLATFGLGFETCRGVIAVSGIYKIHWNVTLARVGCVFRNVNKADASPFWHVKPGIPPFLVVRQKELWTLSRQARQFHQRLLQHDCHSRLVVATGEDHCSIIHNAALDTALHGKEILRFVHAAPASGAA